MNANSQNQSGFTLVEMIIVMVITGIIGGMVAIFLNAPVKQYTDSARRAELTDIADTAFQRMLRDIRTAVPNSVRINAGNTTYIEFIPTKAGGRYRANDVGGTLCAAVTGNTNGDALSFTAADTCFAIIGPAISFSSAGDWIVVGSTQSNGQLPYQNTSAGVLRSYAGSPGAQQIVKLTSASPSEFPPSAALASQRFQVVDGATEAVTYACVNKQLMRYWNYGFLPGTTPPAPPITTSQPIQNPVSAPLSAMLASNVTYCNFDYSAVNTVNQRDGLVGITLQITETDESGNPETVSLYEEVHVNNAP